MIRPRTLAAMQRAQAAGVRVIVCTGPDGAVGAAGARARRARPSRSSATRARRSSMPDGTLDPARADRAPARARGDRRRRGGRVRAQRLRRRRALRRRGHARGGAVLDLPADPAARRRRSRLVARAAADEARLHRRSRGARRARRRRCASSSRDGSSSRSRCRSSSSSRAEGVSKSSALAFLAARLGFAQERTVTIGDGENDLDLVAWGYGVAVENADERVKAVSRWVCPPVGEEGVAQVLEALLDSRG